MIFILQILGIVLFVIALVGTASSTVFLILTLLGAAKFHRDSRAQEREAAAANSLPPVSLLKPVHGAEPRLSENIESFFKQDYPAYEIIFAADEENDAALEIIREVASRYPQVSCRILVTGPPQYPNPPASSFTRMAEVASYDILVTSDSDVEVAPDYLAQVVPPMLDPSVGMLTCL